MCPICDELAYPVFQMTMIVKDSSSDVTECSKQCGLNSWCKSFDVCNVNQPSQFCHLKDKDRRDFDK